MKEDNIGSDSCVASFVIRSIALVTLGRQSFQRYRIKDSRYRFNYRIFLRFVFLRLALLRENSRKIYFTIF